MAITQYYVDPAIAADSGAGTSGDPYGDLQYALNNITRNATDGDQVNIKAGTAEILSASLTLATYGTPSNGAPLILRGYTSAANDGGVAEINCNGVAMWTATTYAGVGLIDLQAHSFGNNSLAMGGSCLVQGCNIHKGSSTPSGKYLLTVGAYSAVIGCYIHDAGTGGHGINCSSSLVANNYVVDCPSRGVAANASFIVDNVFNLSSTSAAGIYLYGSGAAAIGNTIYNSTAATSYGIDVQASGIAPIMNNVIMGFSGSGGKGINVAYQTMMIGYNAFYNCDTDVSAGDVIWSDETANDVALGGDPFTNAAGADFSISAALKALGWPTAFLGASTNTYIDIGAVQRQEAAASCDYPAVGDVQDGVSYGSGAYTGTFGVPAVGDVQESVQYGAGGTEFTGTLALPTEAQVESGVGFGASGTEFTGALVGGSDWTSSEKEQIRQALGVTGTTAATESTGDINAGFAGLASDSDVADAVWDEVRSGHSTAGTFGAVDEWAGTGGATAQEVWEYTTRTLTQSSTSTTDSTAAGSIARRRGDSWSISLTIGAITGYTSLWFTAKWDRDDPDISSVLQIKLNSPSASDGLLYVNGAAASDSTKGSITVSDDTTGAIIIAVDETITQYLPPAGLYYDIQVLNSGTVTTPDSGTLTISADVTRDVA